MEDHQAIVTSEIEVAVEDFLEEDDVTPLTVKKFLQSKIRAVKVDFPHQSPKWIDKEVARVWEEITGRSLASALAG